MAGSTTAVRLSALSALVHRDLLDAADHRPAASNATIFDGTPRALSPTNTNQLFATAACSGAPEA